MAWGIGLLALLLAACSDGSAAGPDGGTGTGSDGDGDTDVDTDTDSDTDQDSGVLGCPGQTDAGPWVWEDQPAGEDCGPGCEQVTFSDRVRFTEWDVWDDRLAFIDEETRRLWLVYMAEGKQMKVPAINPELAPDPPPITNAFYWPALYQTELLHGWVTFYDVSLTDRLIVSNTSTPSLKVMADWGGGSNDMYDGTYFYWSFTMNSDEDDFKYDLRVTFADDPCSAMILVEDFFGTDTRIWEDTLVWGEEYGGDSEIRAYDLASESFIEVTGDDDFWQMKIRLHGRRIVYQDLRYSDDGPLGNWNHAAVFLYDLDTEETIQIAGGDWIACYPDVNGDIIVWQDYRASTDPNNGYDFSGVEIWGYNLSTEVEFQVTDIPGRAKQTPRVWGDKVFVDMAKPGGNGIYRFDLPPEAY